MTHDTEFHKAIPNEWGAMSGGTEESVAQRGRSFAAVRVLICADGLYRQSTQLMYSYGGHGGPVFMQTIGFASFAEARTAGMEELLRTWPQGNLCEPQSVLAELADLRDQIVKQLRQPSLF
jgi:hypothetical protein